MLHEHQVLELEMAVLEDHQVLPTELKKMMVEAEVMDMLPGLQSTSEPIQPSLPSAMVLLAVVIQVESAPELWLVEALRRPMVARPWAPLPWRRRAPPGQLVDKASALLVPLLDLPEE